MPPIARRKSAATLAIVAALLATTTVRAADPYRLQAGDTIDFSLIGSSPIARRIMVGQDGSVGIPLGGSFPAAGRTIDELREAVTARLKTVSYPAGVDTQGATVWSVIYPESILLDIAEFRPVYVSGDVLMPSAQPFRAGMTVAQAVAVAGGASAYRGRQDHSMDRAALGEERAEAFAAAYQSGLQVATLRAELEGAPEPDFAGLAADGLEPALAERLRTLALDQMAARREDLRKSRENIAANITGSEARLGYLRQSRRNLEDETRNYEDEVKRVEALLQKGLTPIDRLRAAQRGVLLVSTRSLDTLAAISQAERDISDLKRALDKLGDTARLDNLAALQLASTQAAQASARIEGLRLKARVVSGLADDAEDIRYVVSRREGDVEAPRAAGPGDLLQPGDLVEVMLSGPEPDLVTGRQTAALALPPAPATPALPLARETAGAVTPGTAPWVPMPTPALR